MRTPTRVSRGSLSGIAAALMVAGVSVPEAAPPGVPHNGKRKRRRRTYYNPGSEPRAQSLGPTPRLLKKSPACTADYAAIGRAVLKRERKALRRLREGA